jgi:hypothetical protein
MTPRSLHQARTGNPSPSDPAPSNLPRRAGKDPRLAWVLLALGSFTAASQLLYGDPGSLLTLLVSLVGVAAGVVALEWLRREWGSLSKNARLVPALVLLLAALSFGFGTFTQNKNATGPLLVGTDLERSVGAARTLRADLTHLSSRLPAPDITDPEVLTARQTLLNLATDLTRRAASRTRGWPEPTKNAALALGNAEAAAARWVEARIAAAEQPGEARLADLTAADTFYRESLAAATAALEETERSLELTGRP